MEHWAPRLVLMTAVNLVLGLMIAQGQAGKLLTTTQAQGDWGITFSSCWYSRSAPRPTTPRAMSVRRLPAFPTEGAAGAARHARAACRRCLSGGFAYQIILSLCGITELSPLTSLGYKMVGVWLGTMLGCGFGVSWTVPGPRERSATGWRTVGEFQRPVPAWYDDAKLGIFVHYGLYSVPGWAVVDGGDITRTVKELGWPGHFRANPYAEWYLNTLRIQGSPTQEYHRKTYGPGFSYDDFVGPFNEANARWDPDAWAALFARVGARYVVSASRHCESFLLWPSGRSNPFKKDYTAKRDVVGELAAAVRARKMRMGLYYCGGFDWCFTTKPITTAADLALSVPRSTEYAAYCTDHWHELIDRYEPSVMWGDVGYPYRADVPALMARYYNRVPDGVVDDRFYQVNLGLLRGLVRLPGNTYAGGPGCLESVLRRRSTCRHPPRRLHCTGILHAGLVDGEEMGNLPGPRLLLRLQSQRDRRAHALGRGTGSAPGGRRQQERQPVVERGADG